MSSIYEYKFIIIKYFEGVKRGIMYLWFFVCYFIDIIEVDYIY